MKGVLFLSLGHNRHGVKSRNQILHWSRRLPNGLFWKDIDSCYDDDWERPAKPAEKRWICENVVESRKNG